MNVNSLLREVHERFFRGKPIMFSRSIEGQRMSNDLKTFVLGMRAGPSITPENLFHEMCHLAERPLKVLLKPQVRGWNFKYGKFWRVGIQQGWEPQTAQQVWCECRVWSYQLSLQRELGWEQSAQDLVESAVFLPAFCFIVTPHYRRRQWWGEEDRPECDGSHKSAEMDAMDELVQRVEAGTREFTYAKFVEEWTMRLESRAKKFKAPRP